MNNFNVIKDSLYMVFNSPLFITFIGLIIFDIFTGIGVAFKNKLLNSEINKDGITKHFTIITFVIFFNCLFTIFKTDELGKIILYFYIGSYGLSIFENLTMLGVPFPKWLKDKFLLLKEEGNRGGKDVVERIKK